jgi:S1-C subfamily serine protease
VSALSAALRRSLAVIASSLALLPMLAHAQAELPFDKVSKGELRQALIWTSHLELWEGDPTEAMQKATKSWQAAKGYKQTETLSEDESSELLAEAVKKREAVGWSTLQDKSIGFSVGVPTRLVKFVGTRPINGGVEYDFDGAIGYSLAIRYGDITCSNFGTLYALLRRQMRGVWMVKLGDMFAIFEKKGGYETYVQATCRTSGVTLASITMSDTQAKTYGMLYGALASSLVVSRNFNPTARPMPKVDESPEGPGDLRTDVVARASSKGKLPPNVDGEGKSARVKLKSREGEDLSTREVFEKVGGAVYVVKAERKMGSAVAISEYELLTNCHVVDENPKVTIGRDKKEQNATVISMNSAADRCVLRTDQKLPSWVSVRPYEDIKVGERAITIGTPHGLELTVAEGLVSSKRTHKGSKLVQTSAPISPGSSGGGLFDAQGELLGITTFYFAGGQNLNFAVAAEEFAKN